MAVLRDTPAGADELAARALAYLAADDERMWRFFDLTGLSPGEIREAAARPGFVLAILDHLLSDESLLLSFAGENGLDPASVMTARNRLAGPGADGWREG